MESMTQYLFKNLRPGAMKNLRRRWGWVVRDAWVEWVGCNDAMLSRWHRMDPWTWDFSAKTQLSARTYHGAPLHHAKKLTWVSWNKKFNQEEKRKIERGLRGWRNFDQMGLAASLKVEMTCIVSCKELINWEES